LRWQLGTQIRTKGTSEKVEIAQVEIAKVEIAKVIKKIRTWVN
jgi:hypothetical protein